MVKKDACPAESSHRFDNCGRIAVALNHVEKTHTVAAVKSSKFFHAFGGDEVVLALLVLITYWIFDGDNVYMNSLICITIKLR